MKVITQLTFLLCALAFSCLHGKEIEQCKKEMITIAILAKDKAHSLDLYLQCLESQTWPKDQTYLYIRTNNNNDQTGKVLKKWVEKVKNLYPKIYFNDKDVEQPVQNYKQHEWNQLRFKVLGKIRQDSIQWAKEQGSHYFVVDCDNFIQPDTLTKIFNVQLPIVAPFLKLDDNKFYSNYHSEVDEKGYLKETALYHQIYRQEIKGLIELPVVHCTYLIRNEVLDKISYDDNSGRDEYVIFSDVARKNHIPQYLDNRELYGRLTFAEDNHHLLKEKWFSDFSHLEAGKQLMQEQKSNNIDKVK